VVEEFHFHWPEGPLLRALQARKYILAFIMWPYYGPYMRPVIYPLQEELPRRGVNKKNAQYNIRQYPAGCAL
jgi:hypothetical protein